MSRHTASRLAALCVVLLSLLNFNYAAPPPADELIVHEWGTFTSVSDGAGQALAWRPLSFESDLPSFVYSVDAGRSWSGFRYPSKSSRLVTVRMETPVLYFYSKEETEVSVKVLFPGGRITEWYPQARLVAGGIEWGPFKVRPGAHAELPHDGRENHYYPARATDAATLSVPGGRQTQHEKFLFYRGVGNFVKLPLVVSLRGDKVSVAQAEGGRGVGRVILFERRGGRAGFRIVDAPKGGAALERPALGADVGELRRELKALLISHGLYEREADAMLDTWRDSWFEEGLRVFYVMPREATEAFLPATIEPRPSTLVRVLVGRTELITPEMERDLTAQLLKLDDPSAVVRQTALKEINKYGRFADSILNQVLRHTTDPDAMSRLQRMTAELRRLNARPE